MGVKSQLSLFKELSLSANETERWHTLALHHSGITAGQSFDDEFTQAALNLQAFCRNQFRGEYQARLEKAAIIERENMAEGVKQVFFDDPLYPALLKQTPNPPLVLFARGDIEALQAKKKISMVGTRNPSQMGIKWAQFIAGEFAREEHTIVSGMARGIDTVCHKAALAQPGGKTIAVLAAGVDYLYPKSNLDLFKKADENGSGLCLISEYPLNTRPMRYHFPRRNRIISGLANRLLMVEGGKKSGALITVHYALAAGREVYALQHPLLKNNEGGEKLVQDGAFNLASIFTPRVEKNYQPDDLAQRLQTNSSFYLGSGYWVEFKRNLFHNAFS